jgi:hypothetical protein
MATADFKCCASDPATFQPWLQHHGSHVTSICCVYSGENKEEDDYLKSWAQEKDVKPELRELHCTNLMKLALYDWAVQLDGPLLQAATGITYLDLHMLNKHDFGYDFHNTLWWSRRGGLKALAALEDLQALQRFDFSVGETLANYNPNDRDQLPSRVICSWSTSLTRLSFSGVLALESYEPFSRFVKLQHLYMDLRLGVQEASAESAQQPFAQLQALTFLSLCMEEHHKRAQASSSLPLSGCSELQELHLYSPSLDAVTLEGLTGLHRLYVSLPALEESGAACFGAVLSDIGHMLHLERLVLSAGFHCETVTLDSGIAELCTALTASGQLSYLDLSGLKLPRSALVHLFPNGRQLPQLHEFKLSFANASTYDDFLDCSALEQMVVCCPAITRLGFGDLSVFKPDVSLVPLLQLRQLADLECPFVMDGASSVGVLARLSSLTRLHLQPSLEGDAAYRLTDESMLQLTALTRLKELGLQHHPWQQHCQGHGLSMMGGHWKITLKVGSLLQSLRSLCYVNTLLL